jgi:hypothetical protein
MVYAPVHMVYVDLKLVGSRLAEDDSLGEPCFFLAIARCTN